jgi:hypothetical protein
MRDDMLLAELDEATRSTIKQQATQLLAHTHQEHHHCKS